MKATLEFNLPDDKYEYANAKDANVMKAILSELAMELRNKTKYSDDQVTTWVHVREFFWEICKDSEFDPMAEP